MNIATAKPPYVTFETRAIEDRNASIEKGHFVAVDTDFAIITPQGSRDKVERVAKEWFDMLAKEVQSGRFPSQWLEAFKSAYKSWKEGKDAPVDGTSLLNWPVASPAQVKMLIELGIRSVEDLSTANEEAIKHLGMGGRALQQKALDWIKSATEIGKASEEISSLRISNENLTDRCKALEETVKELKVKLEANEEAKKKK